jgi:hypothetical protein
LAKVMDHVKDGVVALLDVPCGNLCMGPR